MKVHLLIIVGIAYSFARRPSGLSIIRLFDDDVLLGCAVFAGMTAETEVLGIEVLVNTPLLESSSVVSALTLLAERKATEGHRSEL